MPMNLVNTVILGIVEGLTEFLPISSTAHLLIVGRLLNITQTEFQTFFDVFIQSGAILAVVFIYFQYVMKNRVLWTKILISFLPTAVVGLILEKIIKKYFFNSMPLIISAMFFIGIAFVIFEVLVKKKKIKINKSIKNISNKDAFITGVGQSLAVIPGVSRAGIVMLTLMSRGYLRDESAIYSFLLAVPTILAASALEVIKTDFKLITAGGNLQILAIGFVVSFITAYISVNWLINFLKKNTLTVFGIYRIIISLLLYMI